MSDQLDIRCGPADKHGRRLVMAVLGNREHRDRFDTDDSFRRKKYREHVVRLFALPDDAHDWLEQRIIAAADAEDEAAEYETLTASKPLLLTMADVEARSVNWLWPQRIALGRLTLLVGRPGDGKSFLTVDMTARVSTGSPWPDGAPCPRGSVILISAEDDPADTVRPRLDAHRADVGRVHLLRAVKRTDDDGRESEAMFSLGDIDALEAALEQCNDCKLVVVDPIGSFLGGRTDAHRDNEVRSVLAPVAALAEKYGAAVVVVAHTRKSVSASADDSAMGSRAFTGIARAVWHLSRDGEDKHRRLLLPGKSNIAPEQGGLAFSIGGEPAAVHWERDPVAMTADDAIAKATGDDGQQSALAEACTWLECFLEDGAKTSKQVQDTARADGIAPRTLRRAKEKLGVLAGPAGFGSAWVWQLPEPTDEDFASVGQTSPVLAKGKSMANTDDVGQYWSENGATDFS